MTTHLHPVDAKDVEESPLYFAWYYELVIPEVGFVRLKNLAQRQEIRARKAEAQLAVAVEALKLINRPGSLEHPFDTSGKALAEIKAIGGGE